jgi:hypothetical protein
VRIACSVAHLSMSLRLSGPAIAGSIPNTCLPPRHNGRGCPCQAAAPMVLKELHHVEERGYVFAPSIGKAVRKAIRTVALVPATTAVPWTLGWVWARGRQQQRVARGRQQQRVARGRQQQRVARGRQQQRVAEEEAPAS